MNRKCPKCGSEEVTLILETKQFYPGVPPPKELDFACDNCGYDFEEPAITNPGVRQ